MRVVWMLVSVVACYAPSPPEGVPCSERLLCPTPLICDRDRGTCVKDIVPIDAAIDAPDAYVPDADLTCHCTSATELTCGSGVSSCTLGCFVDSGSVSRCHQMVPSNSAGIDDLDDVTASVSVSGGIATFNTDTGQISGTITRAAGTGLIGSIAFRTTATLGVFTFQKLDVSGTGTIRFTGARPVAFVVETTATVDGVIEGAGGCNGMLQCAGPGGGTGAYMNNATGCGPGASTAIDDCGGGGGGGGTAGGTGGAGTGGANAIGGVACVPASAEPLVGGSGGGQGDPGTTTLPAPGGGGGGGFQLSALQSLTVRGTIDMGGGGGGGGPVSAANSSAGSGGGAGGAILLEGTSLMLAPSAHVAANGGGGGGGGYTSGQIPGSAGARGTTTTAPAAGGAAGGPGNGAGGAGAAGTIAAMPGPTVVGNAGGGGGGAGVVFFRAFGVPTTTGAVVSPPAGTGAIKSD